MPSAFSGSDDRRGASLLSGPGCVALAVVVGLHFGLLSFAAKAQADAQADAQAPAAASPSAPALSRAPAVVRLDLIAPLPNDTAISYFVGEPAAAAGARPGDAELCRWALEDWVRHADGKLVVVPAGEAQARIRIYFAAPGMSQYGEMRPILVDGRRGAEVYVRPDTDALTPEIAAAARSDPLLRETIVYLTCLHEIGHALGMQHTDRFADIMYYFGFGGDIPAFFGRYRNAIESRDDIREQTGLSAADIGILRSLYPDP